MFIEVQFLLTFSIVRVNCHEFTYPWNCDFYFIHENWYPWILMKPQYHACTHVVFENNILMVSYDKASGRSDVPCVDHLASLYCGFINIQGYQFSWIKWKSQFQGYVNSWPMTLSIENINRNYTSMGIKFRGST